MNATGGLLCDLHRATRREAPRIDGKFLTRPQRRATTSCMIGRVDVATVAIAVVALGQPWRATNGPWGEPISLGERVETTLVVPVGMSGTGGASTSAPVGRSATSTGPASRSKGAIAGAPTVARERSSTPKSVCARDATRVFWSARADSPIDDDGAREIEANVAGFFRVLRDWDGRR
jgi:hypothetical protein